MASGSGGGGDGGGGGATVSFSASYITLAASVILLEILVQKIYSR